MRTIKPFKYKLWLYLIPPATSISLFSQNFSGLVILASVFIFLNFRIIQFDKNLVRLWFLALLWGFAQIISNIYFKSKVLTVPALMGVVVMIISTMLYVIAIQNIHAMFFTIIAITTGWIIFEITIVDSAQYSNQWKYGLGVPIAVLLVAITGFLRIRFLHYSVIFVLIYWCIYNDSRGLAICLIFALIFSFSLVSRSSRSNNNLWISAALLILIGFFFVYPNISSSGLLGYRVKLEQLANESNGQRYNFILSARTELPQTMFLFSRHWKLGIGSYNKIDLADNLASIEFIDKNVTHLNINQRARLMVNNLEPTGYNGHSQLGSSLLYAGILAAPFWINFLLINIYAIFNVVKKIQIFSTAIIFLEGICVFDAFFSPLSYSAHISISLAILFGLLVSNRGTNIESRTS